MPEHRAVLPEVTDISRQEEIRLEIIIVTEKDKKMWAVSVSGMMKKEADLSVSVKEFDK